MYNYDYLLNTRTSERWQRIGTKRRAGVAVPLFSLYSQNSVGIGEIPDLKLLIDWCNETGISIIQLLPLNDVGNDFAPYSSLSTFALDPMYLSINSLRECDTSKYENEIVKLKKTYRPLFGHVNYRIKKTKLGLLWKIYSENPLEANPHLKQYILENEYWLKDYALFKVISESLPDARWELWNESVKHRNIDFLLETEANNTERINFYYWLQWQLCIQLKAAKDYANEHGVLVMGDLPFLVSRESADVWSHQNYFRLDLSAGAPPDMYFALGQKWGMPPYNWDNIANDGFVYMREKLKYAGNFYDMYRVDHFVGLFRVWSSRVDDNSAAGSYLPREEHLWEAIGRRIIDEMLASSPMLPCAEDLGTVPDCSYRVLAEYGIPGIDFQRYMKSGFTFRRPDDYRANSCAVLSTHDSAFFVNWWQFEAGTIDERLFEIMLLAQNPDTERLKLVKETLFDLMHSGNGRLRWKENINNSDLMLSIVQPRPEKVNDFRYMYLESFGEKNKFLEFLGRSDLPQELSADLAQSALRKANESQSVFSIQLLHEYLCLDTELINKIGRFGCRLNTPGKVSKNNWSIVLPVSLESLLGNKINPFLKNMVSETGRL